MKEFIKDIVICTIAAIAFNIVSIYAFNYTTSFIEDWFFATIVLLIKNDIKRSEK